MDGNSIPNVIATEVANETFLNLGTIFVHGSEKCADKRLAFFRRRSSKWPLTLHSLSGQLQCHELHRSMSAYSVKSHDDLMRLKARLKSHVGDCNNLETNE